MTSAILSPAARRDIIEIGRWISNDNPAAARAFQKSIINAAEIIGERPNIGRQRPDITSKEMHFFILRGFPYTIVYKADRQPPYIIRVLHSAHDLPDILRDND